MSQPWLTHVMLGGKPLCLRALFKRCSAQLALLCAAQHQLGHPHARPACRVPQGHLPKSWAPADLDLVMPVEPGSCQAGGAEAMINEHHDFGWRCPRCSAKLDGHTQCQQGRTLPAAGDVIICLYCATVFEVSAELGLVLAGLDIINTAEVQRALLALRKVKAKRN